MADKRFIDKVERVGECWLWRGALSGGYGMVRRRKLFGKKMVGAHCYSWYLAHGNFPRYPTCVLHRCDNPPCVNPAHLFLGTKMDNAMDRDAKGRTSKVSRNAGELQHLAKLTVEKVKAIRRRVSEGEQQKMLAIEYGVTPAAICFVVNRKNWRHV